MDRKFEETPTDLQSQLNYASTDLGANNFELRYYIDEGRHRIYLLSNSYMHIRLKEAGIITEYSTETIGYWRIAGSIMVKKDYSGKTSVVSSMYPMYKSGEKFISEAVTDGYEFEYVEKRRLAFSSIGFKK